MTPMSTLVRTPFAATCTKPEPIIDRRGETPVVLCGTCFAPLCLLEYETADGGRSRWWRHAPR
jgi:hypothetical protein